MKRVMKVFGITALIMVVVGMVMGSVITLTKGTAFMNNYMDGLVRGRVWSSVLNWLDDRGFEIRDRYIVGNNDLSISDSSVLDGLSELEGLDIEDFNIEDFNMDDFNLDDFNLDDFNMNDFNIDEYINSNEMNGFDIDESTMFDSGYEIYKGNVDKMIISEGNVSKLSIELGGCVFEIRDSGDDSFYIEAENITKLQTYQKGSALYVKGIHTNKSWTNNRNCHVVLYVPESAVYEEVKIGFGAGTMEAPSLSAEKVKLEVGAGSLIIHSLEAESTSVMVGAGSIDLYDMKVDRLEAQVNAGSMLAEGSISNKGEVECNAGTATLLLDGSLKDYDYDLTCTLGTVALDGKEYSGMDLSRDIQHGAEKSLNLKCSVGSITVEFR